MSRSKLDEIMSNSRLISYWMVLSSVLVVLRLQLLISSAMIVMIMERVCSQVCSQFCSFDSGFCSGMVLFCGFSFVVPFTGCWSLG